MMSLFKDCFGETDRFDKNIPFHLLPARIIAGSVVDEELGLLGDCFLGGFGDEGIDENVDDLQGGIPEGDENQDFWSNES